MKILFGKPKLEYCASSNGVPDGNWVVVDTPKEDTTSLETTEGTDLEAKEEGGEVVDRIGQASSYALSFELFKKKGEAFMLSDKESRGVVAGEYAIRVTSDIDAEAPGYQIDRAAVKTSRLYSPGDTYRKQFTFSALKPANGDTVKDIENTAVSVPSSTTSQSVTMIESDMTPVTSGLPAWITAATVSGTTLSLTLTANSGSGATARTATIEVRGKGAIQLVKVTQEAPAS